MKVLVKTHNTSVKLTEENDSVIINDDSLAEALGGEDGQLIIKEGKARIDDDLFLKIETNLTLPIITRNFFKSQFYKRYPHTRPEHFDLIYNGNNAYSTKD